MVFKRLGLYMCYGSPNMSCVIRALARFVTHGHAAAFMNHPALKPQRRNLVL